MQRNTPSDMLGLVLGVTGEGNSLPKALLTVVQCLEKGKPIGNT